VQNCPCFSPNASQINIKQIKTSLVHLNLFHKKIKSNNF
jgi:hypothetical protein